MLLVKINQGNIEKALKELKGKLIRTKQNSILFDKKEFKKKSVIKREQIKRATHIQKLKSKLD